MRKAAVALVAVTVCAARAGADGPTFTKEVAPILWKNCAGCHHPGRVAPFSLLTYAHAARRAKFLADVTVSRRMPPWRAAPDYGLHFTNERRMSDTDIKTVVQWAEAGAPEGNPKDLPPMPKFREGW